VVDGVHLGPLGTSPTEWPILPAPGDCDDGEFGGMKIGMGKPKYSEKTCPSATLSTTNSTWLEPGSNPGRRGGKSATNRLIYGTALRLLFTLVHTMLTLLAINGHEMNSRSAKINFYLTKTYFWEEQIA
jgi:hypothetical protein